MRIAIPVSNGRLSMHFGHCETFSLFDVGEDRKTIVEKTMVDAPPHQPGLLPRWLHEQGVNVVIAGGMGMRAQQLFQGNDIQVVVGAPCDKPEVIAGDYLAGGLETGDNLCDH